MESQSFSFLLLIRGNTTIKSFEIFSASKNLNLEAYIDTTILMQFSPRFKNVHLVCLSICISGLSQWGFTSSKSTMETPEQSEVSSKLRVKTLERRQ